MNPILKPIRRVRLGAATLCAAAAWALSPFSQAALTDGLVSYWPLDSVDGITTPDLYYGYDMELVNLTSDDLVPGKYGQALQFDNARQTLLQRINIEGEKLPINQHPALTIAFWANVAGEGLSDLRLFSEGSTTDNNPLFNLGTDNGGASGSLDFYFRQTGWTTVDHLKSVAQPLDGTWHHIAFVQEEDGTRSLYVDGVLDGLEIPPKEAGDWNVNTTTIGGILRANPTHWLTGAMDEVAVWERALSETEVQQVRDNGLAEVFPPLAREVIAHWPLDTIEGVVTPDVYNGLDMELVNLTEADLVPGQVGMAMQFDNARQTLLKRVSNPGERLPINQYPAMTISFWANVQGTGQNDLRLFSEGSTTDNNPLFNLGTDNAGASGSLDLFFRQTDWTTVNHLKTVSQPLDGAWHHIAFVRQADGTRSVYVDGVLDELEIPPKEPGDWNVNTTTIGGILRANPTHWLTGAMDEVALWKRALSAEEVQSVASNGVPAPPPIPPRAPVVRSFKSDLPAVAAGDSVVLRWDVTKDLPVTINQGVGNVTSQTVSGLGSIEVTLDCTTEFTLTLQGETESVSKTITVAAIDGVAEGWALLDNFDRYEVGPIQENGFWADLTATGLDVVDFQGNKFIAPNNGDVTAVLPLRGLTINEGEQRTLFCRVIVTDDFETFNGFVGVTDRRMRFGGDVNGNVGPGVVIFDEFYPNFLGAIDGPGGVLDASFEPLIETQVAWNIWVDFTNGPFPQEDPPTHTGDTFSIYAQKEGTPGRITVVSDFVSDRDPVGAADIGFTLPNLDSLVVGGRTGQSAAQNLLIDDIYLSKSGFLDTAPRAFGFSTPVEPCAPAADPEISLARTANGIQVTFANGNLESAASVTGPWTPVGGATSPYSVNASEAQMFFRVSQ